jgi:hypothetical protein
MFSKTKKDGDGAMTMSKIVLATVLVLGAASGAYASDNDHGAEGGYRVGPTGQSFDGGVNPMYHPSLSGSSANALVDQIQPSRSHKKANSR